MAFRDLNYNLTCYRSKLKSLGYEYFIKCFKPAWDIAFNQENNMGGCRLEGVMPFTRHALSQILFALIGLVARANHLFYRFQTVSRVPYAIRPWYESCVRPVPPSDLVCSRTCDRYVFSHASSFRTQF